MDKLVLTDTGGFPLKLDDLLWMDGRLDASNYGLYDAIQSILLAFGTDFIVEGCVYSAPNITAGWIMLDSELMRVDAHAGTDDFFVRTVTFDARGSKTFKDATVNNTYEKIRGVLSGASGSLDITSALRLEDKIIQLLATSTEELSSANIPLATTALKGGVEKALSAEMDSGAADKYPDASLIKSFGGGLKKKVVNIGDWDMNTLATITVAHGVSDFKTIRRVAALIRDDADTSALPIDTANVSGLINGGIGAVGSVNVGLYRATAALFDSAQFQNTSYNRGWIVIDYEP